MIPGYYCCCVQAVLLLATVPGIRCYRSGRWMNNLSLKFQDGTTPSIEIAVIWTAAYTAIRELC